MQQKRTFGRDFFLKLFPMEEWDGSDDYGLILRIVNGQDGIYNKRLFEEPSSPSYLKLSSGEKEILADFQKHPRNNICEPALPIPFSIDQLKDFLQCYSEIFEKFVLNDGYFSLSEVAEYLKLSKFEVFRKLQIRNGGPHLAPSIDSREAINVKEVEGDGAVQQIGGLLEIDGIRGLTWTNSEVSGVNLFLLYDPAEEPWGAPYQTYWLNRRQFMLAPTHGQSIDARSFNWSEIVVSHLALLEYLDACEQNAATIIKPSEEAGFVLSIAHTRENSLSVEIESILSNGIQANVAAVWAALSKNCGTSGSCCLHIEERDSGPVIVWRGAKGKVKKLTEKALADRLRRRQKTR